jgi:hypothetical protein
MDVSKFKARARAELHSAMRPQLQQWPLTMRKGEQLNGLCNICQHAFHIFSYLFIFHIFLYYIFSCQYECTNMTMTLWQTHSTSVSTCFNITLNVFRADTAGEREANPWHDNYSRQFDIFLIFGFEFPPPSPQRPAKPLCSQRWIGQSFDSLGILSTCSAVGLSYQVLKLYTLQHVANRCKSM